MKTFRGILAASLVFLASVSFLAAEGPGSAQLDKIKALAGDWEGKAPDGKAVHASYKLVSGGSAVAETLAVAGEPDMLTVYHLNGGELMMTHYCSLGNQPRMRADAAGADAKAVSFHFVDATNMAGLAAPHMNDLKITFEDANHITPEWAMKGGPADKVVFRLERKK